MARAARGRAGARGLGVKLTRGLLPDPPPRAVMQAAARVYLAARRALRAVMPAELVVVEDTIALGRAHLLGAVTRLGLPALLEGGPRTVNEIAGELRLHEDSIHRALRLLAVHGYVARQPDGRYAATRLMAAMGDGEGRFGAWVRYFTSRSNADAWQRVEDTLRSGEGAFELEHGCTVWQWFDQHPGEREDFAQAMTSLSIVEAASVARAYPHFARLQTLCDVGGGRGVLLSEILLRTPSLRGVLCDNPGVLELARGLLERRGVLGRVELSPCNFFERVPDGYDAYLLKNVLHDWGDDECLTILEGVRRAAKPGSRVLLVESLLEGEGEGEGDRVAGPAVEADVQMMVVCKGGRERTRDEYARLLARAGFQPGPVYQGSLDACVIEGFG